MVTPKWNPDTIPDGEYKSTAEGTCYTGWLFENEITDRIKEIRSSSSTTISVDSYAIDGHFPGKNSKLHMTTQTELNPRIEFEFKGEVHIRRVLVLTTTNTMMKSIEAFVGYQSQISNGDYSSFTSLGVQSASTFAGTYSKAEYEVQKPVAGTILALISTEITSRYIRISEIKVFN